MIHADADDESMVGFVPPHGVILDVAPRPDSVGAKWNRMLSFEASVYLAMVDYRAQSTAGFDLEMLEAASVFEDGIGFIYQHMANLSFPVFQGMTKRMADLMGGFYTEHFPYWFVDHWIDDIAKMTGRFIYVPGLTETTERPSGTQEMREPALWATLYDVLYTEREEIARRILEASNEPAWRKDMLRRNWQLVHQRSMTLNEIVRSYQATLFDFPERYTRLRDKATRILTAFEPMKQAA